MSCGGMEAVALTVTLCDLWVSGIHMKSCGSVPLWEEGPAVWSELEPRV